MDNDFVFGYDYEAANLKLSKDVTNHAPEMPVNNNTGEWDTKYDFDNIKSDRAYADASVLGLEVVLPERNQLQIDIDNEQGYNVYSKNIDRFMAHILQLADVAEVKTSKSGDPHRKHITLTLDTPEINPETRILYQLMLGSDPVREFLSYVRWVNGDPTPTLFFEKPEPKQLPAAPERNLLCQGDYMEPTDDNS